MQCAGTLSARADAPTRTRWTNSSPPAPRITPFPPSWAILENAGSISSGVLISTGHFMAWRLLFFWFSCGPTST